MSDVRVRIIDLFDSTCIKQFESMHCDIRPLGDTDFKPEDDSICTSIECQSSDIQLRLTISATKGFLLNTLPIIGGQKLDSVSFQKDWCLELANRFLGRLKNKLLSHGCSLNMGLPVLFDCHSEQNDLNAAESLALRVFQIKDLEESGLIQCSLSACILNDNMVLDDYEDEDEDWFDESELLHL